MIVGCLGKQITTLGSSSNAILTFITVSCQLSMHFDLDLLLCTYLAGPTKLDPSINIQNVPNEREHASSCNRRIKDEEIMEEDEEELDNMFSKISQQEMYDFISNDNEDNSEYIEAIMEDIEDTLNNSRAAEKFIH